MIAKDVYTCWNINISFEIIWSLLWLITSNQIDRNNDTIIAIFHAGIKVSARKSLALIFNPFTRKNSTLLPETFNWVLHISLQLVYIF